jgi:hypothetical protein
MASASADGPTIAAEDVVLVDGRGLRIQVVAGTEVPAAYLGAYKDAVKALRAPARDKAVKSPATSKAAS